MALRQAVVIAVLALGACVRPNPDVAAPANNNLGPSKVEPTDLGTGAKPGSDGAIPGGPVDLGVPHFDFGVPHHDFGVPHFDFGFSFDLTMPDLKTDPPDLSEPPPVVGVPCGMMTCMDPQYCCVSLTQRGCEDPGNLSCAGGKQIACDGPEDCQNGACCSALNGTTCSKTGDCGGVAATVCHTVKDCGGGYKGCCPPTGGSGDIKYCFKSPC
jgi:hypothetical protein